MSELKIHQFADKHLGKSFQWGMMDCNTFILEYMDLMLGTNLLKEAQGKYSSKRSAVRFQMKYPLLLRDAMYEHGAADIPNKAVNVGDILIKDLGIFQAAHLVLGSRVMSVDEEKGVISIPLPDLDFDYALRVR
jgi:hypothetical protein|tara:strand:- start:273 stop:674 length:402 start_codon:yes stop_codon:yes gene_type:complete